MRNHPDYYDLPRAFYEKTGCPVIANTPPDRDDPAVRVPQPTRYPRNAGTTCSI
jgi:predicted NodU family carbamoyl transferase